MIAEVMLNRIPLMIGDLPCLLIVMSLYVAVNASATFCWFVVYTGVITYTSAATAAWLILAISIGCITFLGLLQWKRKQLSGRIEVSGLVLQSDGPNGSSVSSSHA
ncbi:unnamed protein product [Prorocentrum cordatum]|uniref:Solute carrier family 40 protein n=1 Tax=Prorocentrum cordatum TaxID=2364126 RepID=A0ABN9SSR7_9DINO|nr:unnamed protein product [Polarella glacialis]